VEKALVPALRFPEFRNTGEWNNEPLEKLYSFKVTNSYSRDQLNYGNGSVKNIHYGDIHTKFSTLFDVNNEIVPFINQSESLKKVKSECYCVEGDMIFADASEDLEDVGKSIEIINLNNEKLLSGLHTLLARQRDKKLIIGFGGYLFKSNRIRLQIKKEAQGAKVLGISAGRLSNIEVAFPSDKKEQQKIADCLSSIDELITAQTKNLDALKAHKKGLMQQLFPCEGEIVPKLRFPEFKDSEDWEEKKFEQVFTRITTKNKENNKNVLTISAQNGLVSQLDYFNKAVAAKDISCYYLLHKGDFAYNKSYSQGYPIGAIKQLKYYDKGVVSTLYICFRTKSDFNAPFFDQYFEAGVINCEIEKIAQEGGRNHGLLNVSIKEFFEDVCVYVPKPEEQQKIADCLSSIDEIITAHTQKLDALKAHKKGLIQQLFPAVDEVNG